MTPADKDISAANHSTLEIDQPPSCRVSLLAGCYWLGLKSPGKNMAHLFWIVFPPKPDQ